MILILDRNKIIEIGKEEQPDNTVRIECRYKDDNSLRESWYISKVIRRKNKLYCYTKARERLKMIFNTIIDAKKTKEQIQRSF